MSPRRARERSPRRRRLEAQLQSARRDVKTLALVWSHPQVPWYTKVLALLVLAYVASPIDLVPDFVPVLGQLDDLIVVLLGAWLVLQTIPSDVLAECSTQAGSSEPITRWRTLGALLVVGTWGLLAAITWVVVARFLPA